MTKSEERLATALTAAETALTQIGKPLHYAELSEEMILLGWEPQGKTDPGYLVYSYIYRDIREKSEASKFRFLRRGVFALAVQRGSIAEALNQRPNPMTLSDTVKTGRLVTPVSKARAEQAKLTRTCGNCVSIEFTGVQEVARKSGVCGAFEASGRLGVQSCEDGCPLWKARSAATRAADKATSDKLRVLVAAVNHCAHRGHTWDKIKLK